MINSEFKTPLLQSLAVLFTGVVFFAFVATSGAHDLFGSIWAIFSGIFFTILYLIGLGLGIAVCISALVATFLVAVYAVDKKQSSSMFAHVKGFVAHSIKCSTTSCNK